MCILKLKDLSIRFGGLVAVNAVSLSVDDKQIYSIIGPERIGQDYNFQPDNGPL